LKSECTKCGTGSKLCSHKIIKSRCRECGIDKNYFCIHKKIKSFCSDCDGNMICSHNIERKICIICEPDIGFVINCRKKLRKILIHDTSVCRDEKLFEYLGCSITEFKKHMNNFYPLSELTKDIHIDHIKPISAFKFPDDKELKMCCHYTNLRLVKADINLEKNSKWTVENEIDWKNNIIEKQLLKI